MLRPDSAKTKDIRMKDDGGNVDRKTPKFPEHIREQKCTKRKWSRGWDTVSSFAIGDTRFASNFMESLQNALGTNLDMSKAYHPNDKANR
ncbi:hypothetical protein Tco_0649923 [Tanacetum coccineum]